jgi:hypothetical protein
MLALSAAGWVSIGFAVLIGVMFVVAMNDRR